MIQHNTKLSGIDRPIQEILGEYLAAQQGLDGRVRTVEGSVVTLAKREEIDELTGKIAQLAKREEIDGLTGEIVKLAKRADENKDRINTIERVTIPKLNAHDETLGKHNEILGKHEEKLGKQTDLIESILKPYIEKLQMDIGDKLYIISKINPFTVDNPAGRGHPKLMNNDIISFLRMPGNSINIAEKFEATESPAFLVNNGQISRLNNHLAGISRPIVQLSNIGGMTQTPYRKLVFKTTTLYGKEVVILSTD